MLWFTNLVIPTPMKKSHSQDKASKQLLWQSNFSVSIASPPLNYAITITLPLGNCRFQEIPHWPQNTQQPQQQTPTSSRHGIIMLSRTKTRSSYCSTDGCCIDWSFCHHDWIIVGRYQWKSGVLVHMRISLFIWADCCLYTGTTTSSTVDRILAK